MNMAWDAKGDMRKSASEKNSIVSNVNVLVIKFYCSNR